MLQRCVVDPVKGRIHCCCKTLVHNVERPVITATVLYPLEVANGHATRICENIRNDKYSFRFEYRIGTRRRRAIRALDDELGLNVMSVTLRNAVFAGRRYEHITVKRKKLFVRDLFAAWKSFEKEVMRLRPLDRRRDIDTVRIVISTANIRNTDDLRALLVQ